MIKHLSFLSALLLLPTNLFADSKSKLSGHCQVSLVKEASASSVFISFGTENEEECEKVARKEREAEVTFTTPGKAAKRVSKARKAN